MPAKLPTSLETKIGYIRYTATVKLDRPLWIDQTFGTTFTVIRQLNLNNSPIYRVSKLFKPFNYKHVVYLLLSYYTFQLPVEAEERKQFFLCCFLCCFKSKPLIIHARTPVGGYIPGQTIKLKFTADNSSDYNITKFTIQLIKVTNKITQEADFPVYAFVSFFFREFDIVLALIVDINAMRTSL